MSPIIINSTAPAPVPPPLSGLTLAAAQNELAGRGFDYLSSARMTIMLNDAKNKFEDAWEFPWLQATITGTAPLQISDLKYVLTVKAGINELLALDVRQLAQDTTDLEQPGQPAYWWLDADVREVSTMRVWPVAATSLTVICVTQSPELVDSSDTPLIPPRYHPLWIDYAIVEAYHDSDNFVAAQALQADINARIQDIIARYETRNRQHSGFISQRGYSEDD